jgi:hypothetical protein
MFYCEKFKYLRRFKKFEYFIFSLIELLFFRLRRLLNYLGKQRRRDSEHNDFP